MEQLIYTRKELAALLKVHPVTLLNWEKKGEIEKPIRIGRRVYFTQTQVDNLLK